MLSGKDIFDILLKNKIHFITGVPCSFYGDFLVYLNSHASQEIRHVIAASEGESMGIAAGYHLATGEVPVVYLQNSGLGNAVNPLTSLMDKEVYSIPVILFVSWRGEPGYKDEPQHVKMGKIMCNLLSTMGIFYEVAREGEIEEQIRRLKKKALDEKAPVALIFRKGIIAKGSSINQERDGMTRERALEVLLTKIGENPIISTTGKTSREIFEIRDKKRQGHQFDFLTVGSMGCASSIALGIALNSERKIYVIDGDGALLMKMGTLATIGSYAPKNLVHIVMDNQAHESTGGQPTCSSVLSWQKLFEGANYKKVILVGNYEELDRLDVSNIESPCAIVIRVCTGSREDLGRPTTTPVQNKEDFKKFLRT